MAILLIYPGQRSDPVFLLDILQEAHDQARKDRDQEIADRTKKRVPLDDSTDFVVVDEILAEMHEKKRSASSLAELAGRLSAQCSHNELRPIGDFDRNKDLEGVRLTLEIVSEAQRREWSARSAVAWREYRDASRAGDVLALRVADEKIAQVWRDQVVTCVAKIEGVDGMQATVAESMPGLELAGLLIPLHEAVQYFLTLPPKKALRCGVPAQST